MKPEAELIRLTSGLYHCSTIHLRTGVSLLLEKGARILASAHIQDYGKQRHLIVAQDSEDVAIFGEGCIDGQGTSFWDPCHGEDDRPFGIFRYKPKSSGSLGPLLQFKGCQRLQLNGIRIQNSPGWTVHVFDCDDVDIRGITVHSDPYGPFTDGIGINSSRHVRVSKCHVDTGDDAIVIKAAHPQHPSEDISISDCSVASNCAGLALGAEVKSAIRRVSFRDCRVERSLRFIQIEMWTPGLVEDIEFKNIRGNTLPDEGVYNERPIYMDIQQHRRRDPDLGRLRNVSIQGVSCQSRGRMVLTAQDGSCIKNVTLKDVRIDVPTIEDPEETVPSSPSLQLSNHNPHTRAARAALVADNCDGLTLDQVEVHWHQNDGVPMHGLYIRQCRNLSEKNCRLDANQAGLARVVVDQGSSSPIENLFGCPTDDY
jgi:hypothetical protein